MLPLTINDLLYLTRQIAGWMDHQAFSFSEQSPPGCALPAGGFVRAIGDRFEFGPTPASASGTDYGTAFVFQTNIPNGHQPGAPEWTHDFLATLTEVTGLTDRRIQYTRSRRCSLTHTAAFTCCSASFQKRPTT